MVVRETPGSDWSVVPSLEEGGENIDIGNDRDSQSTSRKRESREAGSEISGESSNKRIRLNEVGESSGTSTDPCLAPPPNLKAQGVLSAISSDSPDYTLGAGDVFFTAGFRDRWCRCESVRHSDTFGVI